MRCIYHGGVLNLSIRILTKLLIHQFLPNFHMTVYSDLHSHSVDDCKNMLILLCLQLC